MHSENYKIHYTDHSFQKLCEKRYGINRGVYNTIDRWFFDKGIKNIINRRTEILNFLTFIVLDLDLNKISKLKFGHGGLSLKLNEYWKEKNQMIFY